MTMLRTRLVRNRYLSMIAKSLHMLDLLLLPQEHSTILSARKTGGDVMESLIGALFLDGGLETAKQFCSRFVIQTAEHDLRQFWEYERFEYHPFELAFMHHVKRMLQQVRC